MYVVRTAFLFHFLNGIFLEILRREVRDPIQRYASSCSFTEDSSKLGGNLALLLSGPIKLD